MHSNDDRSTESTAHEQLIQMLSAILLQLNTLQTMVRNETMPPVSLDLNTLYNGLNAIEQLAREAIHEIRASDDDQPLAELVGVTLAEALSRVIEETAESLGLSSRVAFSGEERTLSGYTERLLYRIAQEALYQVHMHGNVRKLRFTFSYGRDEVQMSIEDDGILSIAEEETPLPHFKANGMQASNEEEVPLPHFKEEEQSVNLSRPYSALRHRIEHLGGSLEIISHIEQGTRVLARVPYIVQATHAQPVAPGAASTAPIPSTNETSTNKKVRVLVVDSQAVSRAGLRHLLKSYADLQVIGEASDGVQAVSETVELGPQVVLMDAQMPNNQSIEALKQIKQLNLDTRVLLLSAQEREEYLYETLRAGADGYVLKDIAPDELAQANELWQQMLDLCPPEHREVLRLKRAGALSPEIAARTGLHEGSVRRILCNLSRRLARRQEQPAAKGRPAP